MSQTFAASLAIALAALVSHVQAKEMYEVWLDFMAGEWEIVVPEVGGTSSYLPIGNTGLLALEGRQNNGWVIHGIIGWCPDLKMFVETDFMSGMSRSRREFTVVNEKVASRGVYRNNGPDGTGHGTIEYQRIDDNTMQLTLTKSEEDKPFATVKFVRKQAQWRNV